MSKEELLFELEELLQVENLAENTELAEVKEWDSMAKLSLMSYARKTFNKKITPKELTSFKTIGDIIVLLNESEE